MNIPKPAIWAGLAALIGVYVVSQPKPEAEHDESEHTHADGTVHKGAHSEHEAEAPDPRAAPAKGAASTAKLVIQDLKKGTGATATDGKVLSMHYRGTLTNGTEFDASYNRGEPFSFLLGAGQVIKGWDQGIKGMKVGGKRKLTIPSSLGYGPQGSPPKIPPDATLIFEVELLSVE